MTTPGGFSVGSVHVDVDVDAKGVKQKLEAALSGVDATVDVNLNMPDFVSAKKRVEAGLSPAGVDVDVNLPSAAELAAVKRKLESALSPLKVNVRVGIVGMAKFKADLQRAIGRNYKVDVTAHVTRVTVANRLTPIRLRATAVVTGTSGGGSGGGFGGGSNPFGRGRGFLSGDFPEAFLKLLNPFGMAASAARGVWKAFDLVAQGAGKAAAMAGRLGKAGGAVARVFSGIASAASAAAAPVAAAIGVAVFGKIAQLIGQISPLVNGLVGIFTLLASAVGQTALAGLAAVPILVSLGAALGVAVFAGKNAASAFGALFKAMSSGDPGDMEAYAEALGKLGPNAQAAVQAFRPLIADLKEIREQAEQKLFEGMADSIGSFAPVVDAVKNSFGGIASAIGDVIDGFFNLGQNTFFVESLNTLLGAIPTILTNIGNGFTAAFGGLTNFFSFLTPIAVEFSAAIGRAGERFLEWTQSEGTREKVQTFFTNAYNIAKDVIGIIWALGGVVLSVFTSSQEPLSENGNLLQRIKDKLNEWKAWLDDPANGQKIKDWFNQARTLALQVWQAVQLIINKFQEWNTPENRQGLADTINDMSRLVGYLMSAVTWVERLYGVLKLLANPIMIPINIALGNIPGWLRSLLGITDEDFRARGTPSNSNANAGRNTSARKFARGGLVDHPTFALIGEAGPEAVIPLRRPIGAIDPAVRNYALTLRGAADSKPGKRVEVTQNIYPAQADPSNVANSILRQLTYASGR